MNKNKDNCKLWGGRFDNATSSLVEEFTQSLDYDRYLYLHDIAGSMAHARMLARQGVLTPEESREIVDGLKQVQKEIQDGEFSWRVVLEDVHMNIENRLTEIVGSVGQKLHTGRSRNDQVALDFRMFVVESLALWQKEIRNIIESLVIQAKTNQKTILPGYTHLQPAQPVSLAHHLLAYVQMFKRDFERASEAIKRTRVSPLGAAALAGTTYPLDPEMAAEEIGFENVFENSMDAVSDRDFALEALFVCSMIMVHLSRMCEEIIIWSNPAFGFIKLPEAYATGSSIMPQKKNPDVAELIRGKTGSVFGRLISLLTTMKALPLAYNRDMQEDKGPFIDAHRTVVNSLKVMSGMIREISFDAEAMGSALKKGYLNATEMADYLTSKGVPFRQAHNITGRAVAYAEKKGVGLEDLDFEELRGFSDKVSEDIFLILDYNQAVRRRKTQGGTGPESVAKQIEKAVVWLNETESR